MGFLAKYTNLSRNENYFYTVYLIFTRFSLGILFSIYPLITVDMKYILGTSMGMVSMYTTVETCGRIAGTAVPLLFKYVNRQLVLIVVGIVHACIVGSTPLLPNIWALFVVAFLDGFCMSVTVATFTVWLIEIWKKGSALMIQIAETGFGIGAILAPVILRNFLVGEDGDDEHPPPHYFDHRYGMPPHDMPDTPLPGPGPLPPHERKARLMWPCIITGACILLIPLSSLVLYLTKPYQEPDQSPDTAVTEEKVSAEEEEEKLFDRPETPRKTIRILLALWYATYLVFEDVFFKFGFTYFQYCPQRLSAQRANEIFSVSTTVYTAMDAINIPMTMKFNIKYVLYYSYVFLVFGTIMLVFGQLSALLLWIATMGLSVGAAAMFAAIYAYSSEIITFTNNMSTLFMLSRALFTLVTPIIIGHFIEHYSQIFIVIEAIFMAASLGLFMIIWLMTRKWSRLVTKLTAKQFPDI